MKKCHVFSFLVQRPFPLLRASVYIFLEQNGKRQCVEEETETSKGARDRKQGEKGERERNVCFCFCFELQNGRRFIFLSPLVYSRSYCCHSSLSGCCLVQTSACECRGSVSFSNGKLQCGDRGCRDSRLGCCQSVEESEGRVVSDRGPFSDSLLSTWLDPLWRRPDQMGPHCQFNWKIYPQRYSLTLFFLFLFLTLCSQRCQMVSNVCRVFWPCS